MNRNQPVGFAGRTAEDYYSVMEDLARSANQLATQFKVCPLCGGINSIEISACFVCSWHGEFEHDPIVIASSFDGLIERCPGLMEAVLTKPKPTSWQRFCAALGFRKIDISA